MRPPNNLGPDESEVSVNETLFRGIIGGIIGSLMYLTASRPDIQFFTCLCVRYQANPKEFHLTTLDVTWIERVPQEVVRYLEENPEHSLIPPSGEVNADDTADKSLSRASVQPVTQSKAQTDLKTIKKRITPSFKPKYPHKVMVILPKKQVAETQHAEVTVSIIDATKSLEASVLVEEQGNHPSTAEAVKVHHEEPSTQTPPLLNIHVTVIPETSSAAGSTILLTISPIIPLQQQSTSTPSPTPTTATTVTSIPALPDFSSLSKEFEVLMHHKFQISSMGELTFFLGLQVKQKSNEIFISQDKYVDEILRKFKYADVKITNTPMDKEKALLKDSDGDDVDAHLYRSMIGSLIYLTSSRPDIMFVLVTQFKALTNLKTKKKIIPPSSKAKSPHKVLDQNVDGEVKDTRFVAMEEVTFKQIMDEVDTQNQDAQTDESPYDTESEIKIKTLRKEMPLTLSGLRSMPDDDLASFSGFETQDFADHVSEEGIDILLDSADKPALSDPFGHLQEELNLLNNKVDQVESSISKKMADIQSSIPTIVTDTLEAKLSESIAKELPQVDTQVQKNLQVHLPDILLKLMYKEFNAFSRLKIQRFVLLHKELSKSLQTNIRKSIKPKDMVSFLEAAKVFKKAYAEGEKWAKNNLAEDAQHPDQTEGEQISRAISSAQYPVQIEKLSAQDVPNEDKALFWNTASSKTVNSIKQIHAIVDGKAVVISESLVRSDLPFDDEDGITFLTNDEIFENLALMGYEPLFTKFTFQKENAHLKTTYKNLFDSISVSRVQTETKIASLQNELQCNIYKNAKLRTQLYKKVSDQKDNTQDTSKNTKFAKQPIAEILPKIDETNALSKPVTSNSVSKPPVSKGVNNAKVIAPGMFRISPDKVSKEAEKVPNTEAAKFVGDFKSLVNEADASLAKHKALDLEIEHLQTELERTKERFENCIIKKETEYAKLWNDWYKKYDGCKYDKISYDKAYKDMQQKIDRLQAQLGYLNGKSKDTSSVSDTRNLLSQKLENKNVELEFQVLNYARENAHLKATYKNLFDSVSVSRAQTKTIIASLKNELQSNIYKNAKLGTQIFNNVSDQKDNTQDTSKNTKFVKQPIMESLPKVGKTNALSNPVTSNSVSSPQEPKGVNNDKVIAPGMFRINHSKTSREVKHVPNSVRASARIKPIIVSQPHVITKKDVNSDLNGLSFTGVDNTKTRRPQPRSNTKNDRGIQICLWCVDLGCSKHMTGNLKLLINFIWKFMGTVRFGNDHVVAILGFGQFCDSDLEVAFRRDACFVRNLEGVDLLKGDRSTNLYIINLYEMAYASPICLMARASSTNLLKFKYHKEHLCPSCEQGKSKRASHAPKPVPNSRQRLHLLHMDLCGPMRIASINGKRTDNGTKFKNQVLKEYFDIVGISHQMSSVRTPQQNGVVKRRNRTLVEAARTMLFFLVHHYSYGLSALCYPKNDREDIGKLGAKGDIGFFIGYSVDSCAYRVYNRWTKKIMETMNVLFDELSAVAFDQSSSKPKLNSMTSGHI
nr:putative ribonuclease H-like domain-containing protein [Tanacetum cinerariifolium]